MDTAKLLIQQPFAPVLLRQRWSGDQLDASLVPMGCLGYKHPADARMAAPLIESKSEEGVQTPTAAVVAPPAEAAPPVANSANSGWVQLVSTAVRAGLSEAAAPRQ
jgi:hypothetical protein